MSLVGKNRDIFSYTNENRDGSKFLYKDFEKTESYHSSFVNAVFSGTSLRGAKMKYCNFTGCSFSGVDFVGTNLRGSNFKNARFERCIFVSVTFESANLKDATFENCYMIGNLLSKAKNVPEDITGIKMFSRPLDEPISDELAAVVQALRENDNIRRSHTLHGKNRTLNLLSLIILKETYSEEDLVRLLPLLPQYISTQFYTFSYLDALLTKISKEHII